MVLNLRTEKSEDNHTVLVAPSGQKPTAQQSIAEQTAASKELEAKTVSTVLRRRNYTKDYRWKIYLPVHMQSLCKALSPTAAFRALQTLLGADIPVPPLTSPMVHLHHHKMVKTNSFWMSCRCQSCAPLAGLLLALSGKQLESCEYHQFDIHTTPLSGTHRTAGWALGPAAMRMFHR